MTISLKNRWREPELLLIKATALYHDRSLEQVAKILKRPFEQVLDQYFICLDLIEILTGDEAWIYKEPEPVKEIHRPRILKEPPTEIPEKKPEKKERPPAVYSNQRPYQYHYAHL
jgi:hypothetical protein